MASIRKRRGTFSVVYTYENENGEKSSAGKPLRPMRRRISGALKSSTSKPRVHSCPRTSKL